MTDDTPVLSLGAARAYKAQDNRLWTPTECLEDAVRKIKSKEIVASKVMILLIDQDDDHLNVEYLISGLKASEALSAVEIAKVKLLITMGYVQEGAS